MNDNPTRGLGADDDLLRVYDEMRHIARRRVQLSGSHSFDASDLVNEAYLRLSQRGLLNEDRKRVFRLAARAMRDILVDRAREKASQKRGGDWTRVSWDSAASVAVDNPDELLMLDAAMERLAAEQPDVADVVHLKFFAGLTGEETAKVLDISPATVDRRWAYARAWLHQQLTDED